MDRLIIRPDIRQRLTDSVETAAALAIPQGTVATRQRRALELLRLELGEEGNP